jgi:Cu(I)/Ag(I) efflux system membrane fusion protein
MSSLSPPPPSPTAAPASEPPAPQRRPWLWWLQKLYLAVLVLGVGIGLIAALGAAQRLGWITAGGVTSRDSAVSGQIYTCPMHPQIRQPRPGRCPICGMELVPATSAATNLDELAIRITPAQRRLANIQTAEVQKGPLQAELRSVGAIAVDESRMATIASYIQGRIERLFADYTGVDVAQGDHLAVVYSPQLYAAQVEYLEARKALAALSPSTLAIVRETQQKLATGSRHRLVELGMTAEQLQELETSEQARSRLTIYAPIGGTVVEKLAFEGMYVEAGEPIYRIADLSTVWLMLELFPEDAARIRFGQKVDAVVQSLPGETLHGRVAFIDPIVDPKKRTVGVRVEFLNEHKRLRPGDYATAVVHLPIGQTGEVYDADLAGRWISPMHPQIIRDEPGACPICGMELVPTSRYGYADQPTPPPESVYVPRSAVLMAGANSVVYVETEPGRFEIRPVTIGPILRDKVVILNGLQAGERVATAGNFLIDSQMQLAGNPSLIDPRRATAARRNTPLPVAAGPATVIDGPAGERLEQLYAAYFEIQARLAADQPPPEAAVQTLHRLAGELRTDAALPEAVHKPLEEIHSTSEHLAHLPLEQARLEAFRPLSHAVVSLAARVRGGGATEPFTHLFCPMVPGGAGDWLQPGGALAPGDVRNPYWGSGMLTCGDRVHVLAPSPEAAAGGDEPLKPLLAPDGPP